MASIYLIRHGQASFGHDNYDCLSSLGEQQSSLLGQHFAQRHIQFDYVVQGGMLRHQQTAQHCLAHLPHTEREVQFDARWNEYDFQDILAQLDTQFATAGSTKRYLMAQTDPEKALEQILNQAMDRWVAGQHDHDYAESWTSYHTRINAALAATLALADTAKHIAVFTSGGPISLVSQQLLGVPASQLMNLNWTLVNAGVTKLITSRKGLLLSSLNEHAVFDNQYKHWITYK